MFKQYAETGHYTEITNNSKTDMELDVNYDSYKKAVKSLETEKTGSNTPTPKFRKVGTSKKNGKVEFILLSE